MQSENRSDVIIVGAGAVGCAVARQLSRYDLSVTVLEKESDVAAATSGRNSAVVHAGFNNRPGSLMAGLCVEGSKGFEALCRTLGVPYKKTGKLLVAFDEEDQDILRRLVDQGTQNGCEGLRLIGQSELHKLAPRVGGIGAMLSPNTAIFDPFSYCIALAENAAANGAAFFFDSPVTAVRHTEEGFLVRTPRGDFGTRWLINCAGLHCHEISAMAGVEGYRIYPCRGEYYILDKVADELMPIPVYPAPKPGIGGLGVHLTPTIDGNLIIGPSAEYLEDPEDYGCTAPVMEKLFSEAKQLLPDIDRTHIIGNYSGIRPKQAPPGEGGFRDFVIKEEETCPGLINLIGIESPGLTASVPIARMVAGLIGEKETLRPKREAIERREAPVRFRELSRKEQAALAAENPEYGEIVCRCQTVTKAEIRSAIENTLGPRTLTAIKYRAWPTTGRCGGGFCLPKILKILVEEYGMKPEEITLRGPGSGLLRAEGPKMQSRRSDSESIL